MTNDGDFEPVLFVHEFYDQPRAGIALYGGLPHRFLCPFGEAGDDYAGYCLLATITDDALNLEREAWDIYYGHGPTPELPSLLPKPIPRFPDAKPRYQEIQLLLASDRDLQSRATIRASAQFIRRQSPLPAWRGRELWKVRWGALTT